MKTFCSSHHNILISNVSISEYFLQISVWMFWTLWSLISQCYWYKILLMSFGNIWNIHCEHSPSIAWYLIYYFFYCLIKYVGTECYRIEKKNITKNVFTSGNKEREFRNRVVVNQISLLVNNQQTDDFDSCCAYCFCFSFNFEPLGESKFLVNYYFLYIFTSHGQR